MAKIYEKDRFYFCLRQYVDTVVASCYRKIEVHGVENIPKDGAVIIAPNHCNTLMDALVVLRSGPEATVFGARADIFNNKMAAKVLRFLKILPMVRKRDGLRNVEKNRDSFGQIVEALENGVRYCMFCEGTHRPKHSLLPINKGIVRIALSANEKFGKDKPVYIVPAGIEYGDYFRYGNTSLLTYGQPINVTEYLRSHPDMLEGEVYKELMKKIAEGISGLITFIPDDELYDGRWSLTKIWSSPKGSLPSRLESNRNSVAKAQKMDPQTVKEAAAFDSDRKAEGISIKSFGKKSPFASIAAKTLAGIVLFPLFVYFAIMALPLWGVSIAICSKVKDKAFGNTVHFAVRLVLLPVMAIIWSVLIFALLPNCAAYPLLLLTLFSNTLFWQIKEYYRILLSDLRLYISHKDLVKRYWALKNK